MSTPSVRKVLPLLPAIVSWYATPSPPLSYFSASIRPGMAIGVPEYGVDCVVGGSTGGSTGVDVPASAAFNAAKSTPMSLPSVAAPRDRLAGTSVYVPVAGEVKSASHCATVGKSLPIG